MGPMEWILVTVANCQHCLLKGFSLAGAPSPLLVEFLHKGHGRLVADAPKAHQKRPSTGIKKTAHEPKKIVAFTHFTQTGLAPTEDGEVCLTFHREQVQRCHVTVCKLETREHGIVFAEDRVSCDVDERSMLSSLEESVAVGVFSCKNAGFRENVSQRGDLEIYQRCIGISHADD